MHIYMIDLLLIRSTSIFFTDSPYMMRRIFYWCGYSKGIQESHQASSSNNLMRLLYYGWRSLLYGSRMFMNAGLTYMGHLYTNRIKIVAVFERERERGRGTREGRGMF